MSPSEANDILRKLVSEAIPVSAVLRTSSGDNSRLIGFVLGFTMGSELVISSTREPSDDSSELRIPLSAERRFSFRFGDRREFAPASGPDTEADIVKWGNTLVAFTFEDGATLLLYFRS
jgi:hypothetical protein